MGSSPIHIASGAFLSLASLVVFQDAHAQSPLLSPTPMAYNWTGFYVGMFGGGTWADIEATELFTTKFGGSFYNIASGSPYGFEVDGGVVGAHVGYDWQRNKLVAGVAGSIAIADLDGSIADPNALPTGAPVTAFNSEWYADITGRGGVAFNRIFIYLKVGVAFLDASGSTVDTCSRSFCGPNTISASGDEVLFGWTVGGGGEWAVTDRWSVGAEYRYYDFNELEVSGLSSDGPVYSQDISVDFHSVRGFVNYRW